MPQLYGRPHTRRDLAAHAGTLAQFAGVRLVTLADGLERGIRMLEFRTGSGFRFTVLIDRAMDIGDCDLKGMAIGWNSPAGFRAPGLVDADAENGLGWLRSFSGLLATCGLDHALAPVEESAEHFNYPFRKTVPHPIHGRVGSIPARLTGYGERWEGDDCVLWCEGVISQATVFGENLELTRRIEAKVGESAFTMHDRVVNRGFYRTPHMLLYHFNVGYPVLAEGARYLAPITDVLWAGHHADYRKQGVGYKTQAAAQLKFREQVWAHEMAADADGIVPVALVNDALGLGVMLESRKAEMPCYLQWQNLQAGLYTMGLEPSTHHVYGKTFANERGEMIWLEHGDERQYHIRFSALDGAGEIAAAGKRIAAIHEQPADDYPAPSGKFPALWKE